MHKVVKALAVVGIAFVALIGVSIAVYYATGGDTFTQKEQANKDLNNIKQFPLIQYLNEKQSQKEYYDKQVDYYFTRLFT